MAASLKFSAHICQTYFGKPSVKFQEKEFVVLSLTNLQRRFVKFVLDAQNHINQHPSCDSLHIINNNLFVPFKSVTS